MNKKKENNIFRVMVARIRHTTHDQLIKLAEQETEKTGRQIYVADLVRDAIKAYLRTRISTKTVLDGKDCNEITYKN